jgi:hypothetical protein
VKLLHRREVYAGSSRDIQQIIDNGFQQRNSFFASDRFRFSLGIARNERAVCSRRGFSLAEDLNPVVDLDGAEEVADAFAAWCVGRLQCDVGAGIGSLRICQLVSGIGQLSAAPETSSRVPPRRLPCRPAPPAQ